MVLLNMPGQRGYLQKISPNIDFLKEWMPTVKKHNNTTVYKKCRPEESPSHLKCKDRNPPIIAEIVLNG